MHCRALFSARGGPGTPRRRSAPIQGYAGRDVYQQLERLGCVAFIPPQAHQAKRGVEAQAAQARCKTPAGVSAAIDRMTHGEGAISELKLRHALDRARCRGTAKLQIQALLAATAINLKRLLGAPDAAQDGQAGGTLTAARHLLDLAARLLTRLTEPTSPAAPAIGPTSSTRS